MRTYMNKILKILPCRVFRNWILIRAQMNIFVLPKLPKFSFLELCELSCRLCILLPYQKCKDKYVYDISFNFLLQQQRSTVQRAGHLLPGLLVHTADRTLFLGFRTHAAGRTLLSGHRVHTTASLRTLADKQKIWKVEEPNRYKYTGWPKFLAPWAQIVR